LFVTAWAAACSFNAIPEKPPLVSPQRRFRFESATPAGPFTFFCGIWAIDLTHAQLAAAMIEPSHHGRSYMSKLLVRFVNDETGATAIEYGLIAVRISIAIVVVVNALGTTLNTKFTSINTSLK
jgi:pilus assembly protein Flp/PilA